MQGGQEITDAMLAMGTFLFLLMGSAASGADQEMPSVGKTWIPFYTGNLSVSYFMNYWGTGEPAVTDAATPHRVRDLKRISCFADCDYLAWCRIEETPGRWDFSFYKKNAEVLHQGGLKYSVFCWLHYPPKWYDSDPGFVRYKCLEHDEEIRMTSLWAPGTLEIYRRFYSNLKKAMGSDIDFIRLALPADYGELGYPAAMTNWLVPQKHAHAGYWCGDEYARQSFLDFARRRYKGLSSLNKAWGTSFASWEQITFPEVRNEAAARVARESHRPTDRRRWLDFVDWYYTSWLNFTRDAVRIVRAEFPDKELILSLGYGSEMTRYGNDYSAAPKLAAQLGISLQTPGNVSYYNLKRISTACHFYGCRYYTEPPGNVDRNAQVERLFNDTSNGVQLFFDYPQNLLRAVDIMQKYKDHMRGHKPIVDFAVFHPTTDFRLSASAHNFPPRTFEFCNLLRDYADYDVVDELMCTDGALNKYRVLAIVEGNVMDARAMKAITAWVRKGGILISLDLGKVETVDGNSDLWNELVLSPLPAPEKVWDGKHLDKKRILSECMRTVGKGRVIVLPGSWDNRDAFVRLAEWIIHHTSEIDPAFRDGVLIDGEPDGVVGTLLPDRILYLNPADKEIEKHIVLRAADFSGRRKYGSPNTFEHTLKLPPHSIGAIPLLRPHE